jgi:major membrane immunogen (membrane-anchored lipoprotein)
MKLNRVLTSLIALLVLAASAWAQDKTSSKPGDSLSGTYKGTGKSDATGEFPLSVEVKIADGKVTGTISSPQGDAAITGGTYSGDGHFTLKFDAAGNEGTVDAQLKGGRIVGNWSLAGITGTLDLGPAGSESAATPATGGGTKIGGGSADALAGEWEATANVGGMEYPFTLKLAVDGDKITGQTVNQMGTVDIKSGSRTGDKVSITVETPQFTFTLTGSVKDGKLAGEIASDQFQGTWEAKKKN